MGCRKMTGHTQLAVTPRDRFLEAAQRELTAFERREREFSKKEREERAAELRIPPINSDFTIRRTPAARPSQIDINRGAICGDGQAKLKAAPKGGFSLPPAAG